MRIDSRSKLRAIAGETFIVRQGQHTDDFTEIISLNDSARLLFEQLTDTDFTTVDVARLLMETYTIDEERALQDAAQWVKSLNDCHVIIDTPSL